MPHAQAAFRTRVIVCFALVYLVWGSSYLATRIGVQHLPPLLMGGVRFVISGAVILAAARLLGRRPTIDTTLMRHAAITALFSIVVSNGLNTVASVHLSSNVVALLNASAAFWLVLFGLFGARAHRPDARTVMGLAIGFVGTVMMVWKPDGSTTVALWPALAVLLGCLGWAIGAIYYRNSTPRADVLTFTALQMLIGGSILLLLAVALGQGDGWTWDARGLAPLAYLIFCSSCLAYTAFAWLASHVSPAMVGTHSYVNPAVAAVLGWYVLDEVLQGQQLVGMAVMLLGVVLVSWPSSASTTPTAAPESSG